MTYITPVDICEYLWLSCSQAVDIFEYLTPPLIEPLMHVYYWPIGPAVRHIFTLYGKVTYPLAKWLVSILSLPLLPSLYLVYIKNRTPLPP